MRLSLLALICIFFTCEAYAQKTIYFDSNWTETTKNEASFYRVIEEQDTLFLIKDYFITGEIQFTGLSKTDTDPLNYEGKSVWYSKTETITQEAEFKDGKKHGSLKTYYSDGTLKQESNYKEDQLEGKFQEFFPSGKIKAEAYFSDNKINGKLTEYRTETIKAHEVEFKNGLVNGSYVFYNSEGQFSSKGKAIDGLKVGACFDYFPSGELRQQYTMKNGHLDGDFYVFNTQGDTTTIGKFDNGKVLNYQSTSLRITNDSKFSSLMELLDGVEHWKTYRDGVLVLESFYAEGKKVGVWSIYTFDGKQLYEKRDYSNSDCSEPYLQKDDPNQFKPFFLPSSRFFSDDMDKLTDLDCSGFTLEINEDISGDLHGLYYYPAPEEAIAIEDAPEVVKNENLLDYKEFAYSEEFLAKNNCEKDQNNYACERSFAPYTYKVFTSEDENLLKSMRERANPNKNEIFFYYQTFEEKVYDLSKNRPSRYMGFKLPQIIIEGLQSNIIDYISIVKILEHDIFSVEKFSGLSAFDALEKEYKN